MLSQKYIDIIQDNAYMTHRGYTIPKSIMTEADLNDLRECLTIKLKEPFGMKKPASMKTPPVIVYRENDKKMYIPRFFGTQRYGVPVNWNLEDGDSIHVPFVKPIRDYQEKIVTTYLEHVKNDDEIGNGAILEVPCGRGKCLAKNTPIMLYDGTTKYVQDITTNDVLMGDDSAPRNVLSITNGREKMYTVKEANTNYSYTVNASHILSLRHIDTLEVIDMNVETFLKRSIEQRQKWKGYRVPIEFREMPVEFPPEMLGRWLGNVHDPSEFSDEWFAFVRTHNLIQSSVIPVQYKNNSMDIRFRLLGAFIDSCGYTKKTKHLIFTYNYGLVTEIQHLCRTLGVVGYLKTHTYDGNDGIRKLLYILVIMGSRTKYIPLIKKNHHGGVDVKKELCYDIEIIPSRETEYYGFEIDGNHRFVLGDCTVTHNTVMALNICSRLNKKTLIIVHKEFLMNQWIERIREFMPTARVGVIQGKKFEIQGNDIVIGMIQTMYDKTYEPDTFGCFGLTIIDEVHRIGSEEFSKTLGKVVTPYMLGISATVDRKDGLTEILYMYIGPKIYSEEREDGDGVQVRGIQYEFLHDVEYNEVEYDFRGNVKFTTMVNKICDFPPRRRFLIKILQDLIQENSGNQIMVLCHKRDLLGHLQDEINRIEFASCGLYIGGMKQCMLQDTEGKQIVLATYAMAAEALDIKTLNTLVMVSPKTDIIQSVGRILRTKGNGKIIVDVIDSHTVFQNQWKKRRAYYRKSDYTIKLMKSGEYKDMRDVKMWKGVAGGKNKIADDVGAGMGKCLIGL